MKLQYFLSTILAALGVVNASEDKLRYDIYGQWSEIKESHEVHTPATSFPGLGTHVNRARVQHKAPEWTAEAVINGEFKTISLSDYRGKWVLLFFYPLDFTFVCPSEIIGYSDAAAEFKKLNTEVIGASVDSKFSHLAWTKQPRKDGGLGKMNIPLISDFTKTIAADYGVLVDSGPDVGVALRGTFLIDPAGVLRHITINDLPVGRSLEESLRLIEAFQTVEASGEVCPLNWKAGGKTIKPDPLGSKSYFQDAF